MWRILLCLLCIGFNARCFASDVIEITPPFPGKLFVPADGIPHSGVIVLHGSEGGSSPYAPLMAKFLAENGFAALAFCYFDCGGEAKAPKELFDVDLSRTYHAWAWLKGSPYVKGKKTAIYGASRGAEQALVLTALLVNNHLDSPDAVAVHAPFDRIVSGYSKKFDDPACWKSAVPYQGEWLAQCGESPYASHPAWNWNGDVTELTPWTPIAIDVYDGPLFLSHGTVDTLWDFHASVNLENRVRKAGWPVSTRVQPKLGAACAVSPLPEVPKSGPSASDPRAEIHYFECEPHVFSREGYESLFRMVGDFLRRRLGR